MRRRIPASSGPSRSAMCGGARGSATGRLNASDRSAEASAEEDVAQQPELIEVEGQERLQHHALDARLLQRLRAGARLVRKTHRPALATLLEPGVARRVPAEDGELVRRAPAQVLGVTADQDAHHGGAHEAPRITP